MITYITIILATLLIGAIYRRRTYLPPPKGAPIWYPYRVLIGLLALVIVPIVMMNLFFSKPNIKDPSVRMEMGERFDSYQLFTESYKNYALKHIYDVDIQFKYVNHIFKTYKKTSYICNEMNALYKDKDALSAKLARSYIAAQCGRKGFKIPGFLEELSDTVYGKNFVLGFQAEKNGDFYEAQKFYEKSIEHHSSLELSYKGLLNVYQNLDAEEALETFLLDFDKASNIDYQYRRAYYYQNNHHFSYFKLIYWNLWNELQWIVLIVAFVTSFVWVIFLRNMDIYNREKWRDLLIVFVLGGAMAQFCLLFYDYFHFNLDFKLNGEFVNDFLYCTIVIGGSEELVKLLPWLLFGFLAKKFKEPFDFIIYASVAALGFAFVENLDYFQDYRNITMRTMISTVSHMFDASLVAFAFVIARNNYRGKVGVQIVVILVGFLAAILGHGFYDFWIISSAVQEYTFLTMIFFIFSLHLWFHFKNTAMNLSPYFSGNQRFDTNKQQDILNFGIVGTLMIQYVLMAWYIGATNVFFMFIMNGVYVAVFMVYVSYQLDQLTLEKSIWKKLSFQNILPFKKAGDYFEKFGNYLTKGGNRQSILGTILGRGRYQSSDATERNIITEERNLSGLELRLFAPKSNKYIGSDLPVSGVCSYKVKVGGNPNWYVFKLNTPIQFNGYISDQIILKNKDLKQSLLDDKIEIYFMFIPSEDILQQREIDISELRFAGRSYSRPLNKERF